MIKACIFDLDGTLTDTLESLHYSVNLTLKEMGLSSITKEQCRSFVGNGARYLIDKAIRAAGNENGDRIEEGMEIYRRIFDANCMYQVVPYDGILEMLDTLKEKGIKLAVLSNKPHQQTQKVVKTVFGDELFDIAQGQQDSIARKPSPDGVLHILDEFGVSPDECLYVGDSEVDVKTGMNAGATTIAVTWGFRSKEVLLDAGALHLIDHPEKLLAFVS